MEMSIFVGLFAFQRTMRKVWMIFGEIVPTMNPVFFSPMVFPFIDKICPGWFHIVSSEYTFWLHCSRVIGGTSIGSAVHEREIWKLQYRKSILIGGRRMFVGFIGRITDTAIGGHKGIVVGRCIVLIKEILETIRVNGK